MDALGTQDIATHFPLVDGDDFLNLLNLDVDEIGDDTESLNPIKASFSNSSSSASGGGAGGGGGGGGEGGVASSPTDEEEDLEWLTNKDAFPALEFNILDDKPAGMGFLGQQHSPVSVLESIVVNGNGDIISSSSSADNRASRGTLQVPTGFPGYTRKKRFGRKPRICFSQDKHLSLVGEQVNDVIQPVKIVRKNRASTIGRRCSHCGSDKTPQWRTGPMGKKTLCNACGVRYKSGRLVPEYRPANSPTFSSVLHSNSHRKIVEMRRQKQAGECSSI